MKNMTFVLFYAETLHVFKEFHATNLNEASSYVLENLSDFLTFKRTCDKCLCISYLNKSGKYSICSFIYISDFHVSHFIDVNSVPDDAFVEDINTAEQGEPVDVENTSASEQDNTVENTSASEQTMLLINVPAKLISIALFIFVVFVILHRFSITI